MDVATLTKVFREANEAAVSAGISHPDDSGPCNTDFPIVFFDEFISDSQIGKAAIAAGMGVWKFYWKGREAHWVWTAMQGSGLRRMRMVAAAVEVLQKAGLNARIYVSNDINFNGSTGALKDHEHCEDPERWDGIS
jgi:hypothetical protein